MARTTIEPKNGSTVALAPLEPTQQQQIFQKKYFKRTSSFFDNRRCQWNKFWILSLAVLIVSLLGLLIITLIYSLAGSVPFDYGIVFDAGSTHTEMILYTWEGKKWYETGVVRQVDSCYLSGGIGQLFVDHPQNVQKYLGPCLSMGINQIPEDMQWNSPVYLAATAGMRMLQMDKGPVVKEILGNVTELFQESVLKNPPSNVKIITGQQEGVSAWVAVNYLSGMLLRPAIKREVGDTIGALDLGGASTQITFESGASDSSKDRVTLRLYGQEYNITADSYLCYGVEQLILRHQVSLLAGTEAADVVTVDNPCRAVGHVRQETVAAKLRNPCTDTTFLPNFNTVNFQGTGDAATCATQLRQVVNAEYCKTTFLNGNCMDQLPPSRPANTSFLAFSTFYYIASGFNVTSDMGSEAFLTKVNEICAYDEATLNATNFPEVGEKYKQDLCYEGIFMYILLKEQYTFSEDEWTQTQYVDKINDTSVGWALGFMIENTNVIPMESPLPGMPVVAFIILSLLFIAMIGLALWFAVMALKINISGGKINQTGPLYGALA